MNKNEWPRDFENYFHRLSIFMAEKYLRIRYPYFLLPALFNTCLVLIFSFYNHHGNKIRNFLVSKIAVLVTHTSAQISQLLMSFGRKFVLNLHITGDIAMINAWPLILLLARYASPEWGHGIRGTYIYRCFRVLNVYRCLVHLLNTRLNKTADILQTTFSNEYGQLYFMQFFKFQWNIFVRGQYWKRQHLFVQWLGIEQATTSIYEQIKNIPISWRTVGDVSKQCEEELMKNVFDIKNMI